MKVRRQCSIWLFAAVAFAAIPNPAQGQDPNAHLYIAHAAPGRNISITTNPTYPVDVSLRGVCVAQGQSFGEIRGPFTVPPGTYAVHVTVANASAPCTGAGIFGATLGLSAGSNSLGVIGLSSSNSVTAMITSINLSSVPAGQGRLFVVNTSQDGLVGSLTLINGTGSPISANFPGKSVISAGVFSGLYSATIYPLGSSMAATGPVELGITSRSVNIVVLAGSTSNNSVQLVGPKEIQAVF